ncbi:MAG: HAMP domain-containing histidine kinase [Eubacterium sp.]|nr:HAMP domain-containing histidine kinase [Eubacterium sp.]
MLSGVFVLIFGIIIMIQFLYHIFLCRELHTIYRQLEEIGRGSHIELCIQSRQPHLLALCKILNSLFKQQRCQQLKYEKAQNQLKQNITSLAHDIRTPLTGAVGYVQLAQECGQEKAASAELECRQKPEGVRRQPVSVQAQKQQRYLQTALDRMKELGGLLEELFLYTKLASQDFEPNVCEIQVLPVLSDCLAGMYQAMEEKGMAPQVDFAFEGVRVLADEECLRRIFHNLICNALVHGAGELVIRQEKSCLIFENKVSAPKMGMPDMEQVFDRFYKADSARRKGSSGLGLFIVRELAEKMGGSVRAEMDGETFRILLELRDGFLRIGAGKEDF